MLAYDKKLVNQRRFRAVMAMAAVPALLLILVFLTSSLMKWAIEKDRAHDAMLRKIGCVPEEMHTYHSVMFGVSPKMIWRCDGKLVYHQFANVLVRAREDGDPTYWQKLQAIKK